MPDFDFYTGLEPNSPSSVSKQSTQFGINPKLRDRDFKCFFFIPEDYV